MKRLTRPRNAFTLVEITIGMGLLLALVGIFLTVLQSSSRESALSSDHFTSAMLSQKVIEDLMEEVDLNPLGFAALGIQDGVPLTPTPVTDGAAPFFKHVEDRLPPWGKIDGQKEGAIDSSYLPLFNLVRNFRVSAEAKRLAPAGSTPEYQHLIESGVGFDWKAKVGTGNSGAGCRLFSPVGPKPASGAANVPTNLVDSGIAADFFDAPGQSAVQLISQSGADQQTVWRLGTIHVFTKGVIEAPGFTQTLDRLKQEQTKAQGPFGSKLAEYQARQNFAKAAFDLANTCFLACYLLATDVAALKGTCTPTDLGDVLTHRPEEFTVGLRNYAKLFTTWRDTTLTARQAYLDLLSPNLAGVRGSKQQLFVIRRLLDLFRIIACEPSQTSGLTQYRQLLEKLQKELDGRNPYLHRLLQQERTFATTADNLAEKHPYLGRVRAVTVQAMPACNEVLSRYAGVMDN